MPPAAVAPTSASVSVLRAALERRGRALPAETSAFRWIDGELGPAVTVDRFGDVAVLSAYEALDEPSERALAGALVEADASVRAVYVKRRPREARRANALPPSALSPEAPLVGEAVPELVVREGGAAYEIRPPNGLSVGLYLDARDARRWVRRHAQGRRVLNLFAYTCGFAVAARLGGALRALNVDLSRRVLDWGARNLRLNAVDAEPADFVAGDTFDWLRRLTRRGDTFDLVVVDPPGFATGKARRFSAARDYAALAHLVGPVVSPGGAVLALCNVATVSGEAFERQLLSGLGARRPRVVERFGASPVDFAQPSALKCLAVELP